MTTKAPIHDTSKPVVPDAGGLGVQPDEGRSILSTLNDDGTRRWLTPRVSPGRFLSARRLTAYALILLFVALPVVSVNGKPVVLLDIIARRFHFFGATFHPTDTLLLALLLVGVFLLIFWITALLGRVWCGWACPQTVYMEFLYRPIERWCEGTPGRPKKGWLQTSGVGKPFKFVLYLVCSIALAHVFLAYFVSWENLHRWVFGSPSDHPVGFAVVMSVSGAMMFDFGYFREQVCLVACPYGRFQSVMLDRHSMTIRYDRARGEPRGPRTRSTSLELPIVTPAKGDCIDCRMCVTTCPTGIDIRNGVQMECIGCAQCIDACDTVMNKIGRPRGLIRYSTQAAMEGKGVKLLRPRVVLYPVVLAVMLALFLLVLSRTGIADVTLLRGLGQPFILTENGEVDNTVRVKIVNRLNSEAEFTLAAEGPQGLRFAAESSVVRLHPGDTRTIPAQVFAPRAAFRNGRCPVTILVSGPENFTQRTPFTLLGPASPITMPQEPPR